MTSSDKLGAQIDDLWNKHLPLIRARIQTIRSALDALYGNGLTADLRAAAAKSAHKLAGSLGTYGLERASDDAAEIERVLAQDFTVDDKQGSKLGQHLARLAEAIETRKSRAN